MHEPVHAMESTAKTVSGAASHGAGESGDHALHNAPGAERGNRTAGEPGYHLASVKRKRISGFWLKFLVAALESPVSSLIIPGIFRSVGVARFRKLHFEEAPMFWPRHGTDDVGKLEGQPLRKTSSHSQRNPDPPFRSVSDYLNAFRTGVTTPLQVAEQVLQAIELAQQSEPPLNAFVSVHRNEFLHAAEAATKRYSEGRALGKLEGVVVAVKDELDMAGFPTTAGSCVPGLSAAREDSSVVKRLRAAGALIVGKTTMHEIGLGVTGLNVHQGTPRNAYAPGRYTGGSSSGSAAVVAAGLVPVAVAADGGGSIRIPAAFCGLFGLKPTYGRVSEYGAFPLCWSVAHIGPIAASAGDLAALYEVIAGPDAADPMTLRQPPVLLADPSQTDVRGIRMGIYRPWFNHADPEIVLRCSEMVQKLEEEGASIVEIEIPDLEAARLAHAITITSEMAQAMDRFGAARRKCMGLDVRLHLALAQRYRATDYVQAQRVRARLYGHFMEAFGKVDIILTPTTAILPPVIRPEARLGGECDLEAMTEIMRFVTPANLAGLPAISVPAGFSEEGVPIGLQGIATSWNEHTLMRLAFASEKLVTRARPRMSIDCLQAKGGTTR